MSHRLLIFNIRVCRGLHPLLHRGTLQQFVTSREENPITYSEVQSFEDGDVIIKYLLRCSDNVYQWSEGDNQKYSTEPMEMVVGQFQPPTMVNICAQWSGLLREPSRFIKLSILNKYCNLLKLSSCVTFIPSYESFMTS